MAPVAPLGRDRAIGLVRKGQLPVWFGSPHPHVMILEQDGVYRIRQLVVDETEAKAGFEAAMASGGSWMPEHHYALGKPTGKIYLEAKTAQDLADKMAKLSWPKDW